MNSIDNVLATAMISGKPTSYSRRRDGSATVRFGSLNVELTAEQASALPSTGVESCLVSIHAGLLSNQEWQAASVTLLNQDLGFKQAGWSTNAATSPQITQQTNPASPATTPQPPLSATQSPATIRAETTPPVVTPATPIEVGANPNIRTAQPTTAAPPSAENSSEMVGTETVTTGGVAHETNTASANTPSAAPSAPRPARMGGFGSARFSNAPAAAGAPSPSPSPSPSSSTSGGGFSRFSNRGGASANRPAASGSNTGANTVASTPATPVSSRPKFDPNAPSATDVNF